MKLEKHIILLHSHQLDMNSGTPLSKYELRRVMKQKNQ